MLIYNPSQRLTLNEIKEHPWYLGNNYFITNTAKLIIIKNRRKLDPWVSRVRNESKGRGNNKYPKKKIG